MIKQFRKVVHNSLGIGTQRIHLEEHIPFDKIPTEIYPWIKDRFADKDVFISVEDTERILLKAYEYHCNEFDKVFAQEQSYEFYDWCVDRLEDMLQKKNVTTGDIAPYYTSDIKRALRVIIERAGNLKLVTTDASFYEYRFASHFNKLFVPFYNALYLTNLIYYYRIVEGSLTIALKNGQYEIIEDVIPALQRRIIKADMISQSDFRIADTTLKSSFEAFLLAELNCSWTDLTKGLSAIANYLLSTDLMPMEWKKMIALFCSATETPFEKADHFFRGVYFMPEHLSTVKQRLFKRTINKQMFRPLLIWDLNEEKVVTFRSQTFRESISYLLFDVMPWNIDLIPSEWGNQLRAMKYFVPKKKRVGDILEAKVREILKAKGLMFIKNFPGEEKETKQREIENDFLVLNKEQTTMWVVECKNLMKRFDGDGWMADKERFVGKNGFFESMERKVRLIPNHYDRIRSRFLEEYGKDSVLRPIADMHIKSVYVLNSPTIFMYRTDALIFSWKHFEMFIQHDFQNLFLIYQEGELTYSSPYQVIGNFPGFYSPIKNKPYNN